jgi:hypothetical protein
MNCIDFSIFIFARENEFWKTKKTSPSGLDRARMPDPHPLRPSLARRSPSANPGRTGRRRRRLGCGVRATPGTATCPYIGGRARGRVCLRRRRHPCPASAPPDQATAWSAAAGCLPDSPALLTTGASGRHRELWGAKPHL